MTVRGPKFDPVNGFTGAPLEWLNGAYAIQAGGFNFGGPFTSLGNTGTAEGFIMKPTGDGRQGIFGWQHADSAGYIFHFESRDGGAAPGAMIGIGLDRAAPNGTDLGVAGILIANKLGAQGLIISNTAANVHAQGYGFYGTQSSATAPHTVLVTRVNSPAPLLTLQVESGTPTAGSVLQKWVTAGNHLSGDVSAYDGTLRWIDPVTLRDTQVNKVLTLKNDTGAGNVAQITITDPATNPVIMELSPDQANKSNGALRFYRSTGSSTYWASRIAAISQGLALQASGAAAKGSETWTNVIEIRNNALGFFNATPVAKPTVSGAKGSNAALGSLLTALANLGLITDSSTT